MESSEDDAGAVQDATLQPSARENTGEQLSGEVGHKSSHEGSAAVADAMLTTDGSDRDSTDSPNLHTDVFSSRLGMELQHSTEDILSMIDDYVDGPGVSKRTEYLVDSPDSANPSFSRGNIIEGDLSEAWPSAKFTKVNCNTAGSLESTGDGAAESRSEAKQPSGLISVTAAGRKSCEPAPDERGHLDLEEMVNIVSSTDKTAVIVPVIHNAKVRDHYVISSSESAVECTQLNLVNSVGQVDSVSLKRTSPENILRVDSLPQGSAFSTEEPLVSSRPPSLSNTLSDISPIYNEPPISPVKSDNIACQRRKLKRLMPSVSKLVESSTEVNESSPALIQESPRISEDAPQFVSPSSVSDEHLSNLKISVNDSQEESAIHVSPKKVKLVRNNNFSLSTPACTVPQQPVGDSLPNVSDSLELHHPTSSLIEVHSMSVLTAVIPAAPKSFPEIVSTSAMPVSVDSELQRPVNDKTVTADEALLCASHKSAEPVDPISPTLEVDDEVLDNEKEEYSHPLEAKESAVVNCVLVPTINNLNEVNEEHDASSEKSNEVLDVRKVSPLKLSRAVIDESLKPNTKLNAFIQKTKNESIEDIPDVIGSEEYKNVPKLTLKLPKTMEEIKQSGKVPKLNIKPIRPPDSKVDGKIDSTSKINTKNTMKIDESEVDDECESVRIPNVFKINIKPILKPLESSDHSKSSSSSEVSESDSSESDVSAKYNQTHLAFHEDEGDSVDQTCPAVPKLTIKSLTTTPKVDCDGMKHKVKNPKVPQVWESGSEPSSVAIPKVTIKPILQPPLEKMTIKINKCHETNIEHRNENEADSHNESIPKMTIKIGKSLEHSLDETVNECDEDKFEGALKLTIKLGKGHDNMSVENKADSSTESSHITKPSKRNNQKGEQIPLEPSVPKLTIKIPPDHEARVAERDSPTIPKVTIKPIIKPDDHISVPRINIKPIVKSADDLECEEERNADSISSHKMPLKSKSKNASEEQSVPKINIKSLRTVDEGVALNEREEVSPSSKYSLKHAGKHAADTHDNQTVPKLTIKAIPIPENMDKPLEIITTPSRATPGLQESGQDSPRIILKINKTMQGSTSEILTEKTLKKDTDHRSDNDSPNITEQTVPKLTIKIPPEHNSEGSPRLDDTKELEVDSNLNSPVGRIKLKLAKEGSHAKIINTDVEDSEEISKENVNQTVKAGVKRGLVREDNLLLIKKSPDGDRAVMDAKRLKLDHLLSNSNVTVTRLSKQKNQLANSGGDPPKSSNASISVLSLGSKEENITSEFNKVNSAHNPSSYSKTNSSLSNNGDSKLQNILTRLHAQKDDKLIISSVGHFPFTPNDTSVHGDIDSNTTSTTASYDEAEAINQLGTESPVFNKVDGDLMALNDGSSSQECMIVDDLSQDPLDIGSTAKSHFIPTTTANTNISKMNSGIVNIVAQSSTGDIPPVATTPFANTPRKRGRPRKIALADGVGRTIVMPTPALEERPVRTSRTPRDRPAILRTPRTRGRARGMRRGLANSANREKANRTPLQSAHSFFLKLTSPDSDSAVLSADVQPCQVQLSPLGIDDTPKDLQDTLANFVMMEGMETPESSTETPTTRGRGRGRGSRGARRGRGSRGSRSGRGSRGSRVVRGVRGAEEIQLQDAVPTVDSKREGRKSKLEPTLTPALQVFEEETCMIGDNGTPHRSVSLMDEESQSSVQSGLTTESSKYKRARLMDMLDEGHKDWTAADVAEYDWPPEESAAGESPQTVMIQEQVALYLGVKSFKRRYPDLKRRPLCADEKNFIRDKGLITEALCDLGVTAVDAGEVLDIMYTDYPSKYEEYRKHLRERREARPPAPPKVTQPPPAPHLAQLPGTDRSKQESMERACQSAAAWNARLNRQRRTIRPAAVDLQTMTLHRPRRPQVPAPAPSQTSHYPVALLPGQYTDFFRTYTPEELRFFPLNTALSTMPSPKREDTSSEESDNDSDVVASSGDDSGSETSERHFRRKSVVSSKSRPRASATGGESNSAFSLPSRPASPQATTPAPVDLLRCKLCGGTEHANRRYAHENFVTCATCQKKIHPSCLDMAPNVAKCVRLYPWQCADCKCCAHCQDLADDDKMLFCDLCDRGYHIYCVGLRRVPTGRWHCSHCAICRSCDARSPSGQPGAPAPPPPAPPDQWHHHLKKGSGGNKVYSHTLCAPCARAWRAGRYCSRCERCFMGRKGAMKLVICVNCDRRFHQDCVKQAGKSLDVLHFKCLDCRRGNPPKKRREPGGRGGARRPSALRSPPPDSSHLALTDSNHSSSHNLSTHDHSRDSSSNHLAHRNDESCSNSGQLPDDDTHDRLAGGKEDCKTRPDEPSSEAEASGENDVKRGVIPNINSECSASIRKGNNQEVIAQSVQMNAADSVSKCPVASPLGVALESDGNLDEDENEADSRSDPLGDDDPTVALEAEKPLRTLRETPMDVDLDYNSDKGNSAVRDNSENFNDRNILNVEVPLEADDGGET